MITFKDCYLYTQYIAGTFEEGIRRVNYVTDDIIIENLRKIVEYFIEYHIDDDYYYQFIFPLCSRLGPIDIEPDVLYNYLFNNFKKLLKTQNYIIDPEAEALLYLADNYENHLRKMKLKNIL